MIRGITRIVLLVFLFACGGKSGSEVGDAAPAEDPPKNTDKNKDVKGNTAVDPFKTTIFPIVRKHCVSCHSEVNPQGPTFAHSDPKAALESLFTTQKINVAHPQKSRLVKKLAEGHNCWSDCQKNSEEILEAVEKFVEITKIKNSEETELITDALRISDGSGAAQIQRPEGTTIVYEAESGMRSGIMIINNDPNASGGSYAYTMKNSSPINNQTDPNQPTDGSITYSFNIANAGTYHLWARGRAADGESDSVYIRVNGNLADTGGIPTGIWNGIAPLNNQFTWTKAPLIVNLSPGITTITFDRRELGAELDIVALTTNENFTGEDSEPTASNSSLRFDLKNILKIEAIFVVDIIELTEDSYMISSPRIVLPSGKIEIKSPKVLINGVYHPHHNAFNAINQTVSAPGGELSNTSMVVVRERAAPDEDEFSFTFDVLEIKK